MTQLEKLTRGVCDLARDYMKSHNPRNLGEDPATVLRIAKKMYVILSDSLVHQEELQEDTNTELMLILKKLVSYIALVSTPRPRSRGLRL